MSLSCMPPDGIVFSEFYPTYGLYDTALAFDAVVLWH